MRMKKSDLSVLVLLIFVFLSLLTACEKKSEEDSLQKMTDWIQYGNDKDGSTWSYNRNLSVNKDGENYIVNAWAKRSLSDKGREKAIQDMKALGKYAEGFDKLSEDRILNEVDCGKQRFRIVSIVRYDSDGKILYSQNVNESVWQPVVPNTNGGIFYKKVCPQP
ncbi:MAG: surface-adhesin E family protein [Smithella sp.]